ncbi:DUF262 domain-containing protein [Clostridium boliviensis]|uniref:DUF262 domain-containing protein n=1 Tax=Clostridium boliviensis TaxID=318465 RepID=A0ABU4GHX5_9CLOT|nr:DUF262 domain-containing protein [Clostridium boliviensis]MDW2797210.1 DUF262 domain-containing protein [Clostridium boliviensis]
MQNDDILSFYELLNKYEVKIPIIQRDYAQGRKTNEQICLNFLRVLKNSVVYNETINLDFVYGNIVNDAFQPLDGQQRLTTLYLLHWYGYVKESTNKTEIRDLLLKFTYETRLSSRRFCEALISHPIVIPENEDSISALIKNTEWFFTSWNQDPTIRSMLNTIDNIHSLFKDVNNLWESLSQKKLITFHLLILEYFGLSDDLYIKMNARGKLLTPFENLKAELQNQSQKEEWEVDHEEMTKFSYKIDTAWTDFIWNKFRQKDVVDESHMNFITTLIMFKIALGKSLNVKATERAEIIQRLNDNNSDRLLITYINEEVYKYIYDCYELYSNLVNNNQVPNLDLNMWRHKPNVNLLNQILIGADTSYTHKALFFAQTEYLLHTDDINIDMYLDWMRVVRNVVSRGDITVEGKRPDIIRSPDTFSGAINLIKEMSEGCENIYQYLSSNYIKSAFAKEQMREEELKSQIIINKPEYKELIHNTEDNELLRGKIAFALQCSGYNSNISEINFDMLSKIQKVFEKYFNMEYRDGSSDMLDKLRRCMLTIEVNGDYEFYNYWWSYWNAGKANKRRLFVQFREIEYYIGLQDYNNYFKKLILLLIDRDLDQIISNFEKPDTMPNWQFRLIKESNILTYMCKSKYIAIPKDNSCCYLLKSKRTADMDASPRIM